MADQIVAQYILETEKTRKALDEVIVRLEKVESEGKKAANSTKKEFENMSTSVIGGLKNIAAAAGIAFGAQQVITLVKEMVTLAAQAEGVERAFKRVGSPQLLEGLRKATRGTVSDLQLMQNAVKASNFKIPLDNLASLFKFAQARARETGESVDYLVDSIILGIGRKSPLILDNLGISAVALKEKLNGVATETASVGDIAQAVGTIATEELAKMGEQADTTADQIAQLSTSTDNLKIALGKLLAEEAKGAISFFTNLAEALADDITEFDRFKQSLTGQSGLQLLNTLTQESAKLKDMERDATEKAGRVRDAEFNKIQQAVDFQRRLVDAIKAELDARVSNNSEIEITTERIDAEIAKWKELANVMPVRTIELLSTQLKDLQTELKNAEIGSAAFFAIVDKVDAKTRELNEAMAMTKINEALQVDDEPISNVTDEVVKLGYVVENVFGEDGSQRISDYWDAYVNDALAAMDATDSRAKQSAAEQERLFGEYINGVMGIFSALQSAQNAMYAQEEQNLENQLNQGLLTREEYDEKRKELMRQQAADQKEAALFEASINGLQSVVQAYSSDPTGVLAAIVGAAVAAEIAAIAAQPLPQFAEGGFVGADGQLHGRKHSGGGIKIEAEGGEFITSAKYAQPNRDVLKAINTGNWERFKAENIIAPAIQDVLKGGFEGLAGSYQLNSIFNDKNILKTLDRNRQAERDGFVFLANEITKNLKGRRRGGFN